MWDNRKMKVKEMKDKRRKKKKKDKSSHVVRIEHKVPACFASLPFFLFSCLPSALSCSSLLHYIHPSTCSSPFSSFIAFLFLPSLFILSFLIIASHNPFSCSSLASSPSSHHLIQSSHSSGLSSPLFFKFPNIELISPLSI